MTRLAGQIGLRPAQGHPDDLGVVAAGRVQGHGAPAAAHVEQAHARTSAQSEFAAHQVVLRLLGLLQGGIVGHEPGARVRHAGPEHQTVELIADVVVMADDGRVTTLGMASAAG